MLPLLRHRNYCNIVFSFFFLPSIRISGKNIVFDDKSIEGSNFYKRKKTV